MERSSDDGPAAVCITCRYEFLLSPQAGGGFSIGRGPVVAVVCLIGGLGIGMLLAALSSTTNVGGWILILIGVGLVTGMGALEAGYLDGLLGRRRRPPAAPPPKGK
jgi:hypothetical protein